MIDLEEVFEGGPRGRERRRLDEAEKVVAAAVAFVKAQDAVWACSSQVWRSRMEDLARARKRFDRLVRQHANLPDPHPMRDLDGPVEL